MVEKKAMGTNRSASLPAYPLFTRTASVSGLVHYYPEGQAELNAQQWAGTSLALTQLGPGVCVLQPPTLLTPTPTLLLMRHPCRPFPHRERNEIPTFAFLNVVAFRRKM